MKQAQRNVCARPRHSRVIGDNTGRLEKFRIKTVLSDDGRQRMVYKQAASEKARDFLMTILAREDRTAGYVADAFDVLRGQLQGSAIRYDYVPYLSVQQHIGSCFVNGRADDGNAIFATYVQKLRELPRLRVVPEEFMKTIAGQPNWTMSMDCLQQGLLDLVPRNILVTSQRWLLLDNEWSFEFAVPLDFVIFRAIRELAMTLQEQIRIAASPTNRVRAVFAGGINAYYVPTTWFNHLGSRVPLNRMLRWEAGFQRYVTGQRISVGRIRIYKRIRVGFSDANGSHDCGMRELFARLPLLRRGIRVAERGLLYLRK